MAVLSSRAIDSVMLIGFRVSPENISETQKILADQSRNEGVNPHDFGWIHAFDLGRPSGWHDAQSAIQQDLSAPPQWPFVYSGRVPATDRSSRKNRVRTHRVGRGDR